MKVWIGKYLISTEKSLLNYDTIHKFLSRSYWANLRPVEQIIKSIENSLCFGVYDDKR